MTFCITSRTTKITAQTKGWQNTRNWSHSLVNCATSPTI